MPSTNIKVQKFINTTKFISRQVFLFLLATNYSKYYKVLHSQIFISWIQMSLSAPVQLRAPEGHVWHVDLSDIYLKRNSVSKYFPLFFSFFVFFQMKLLGLQVFICRCWQDQTPEINTWYRFLVTGFNRMPQLCEGLCVVLTSCRCFHPSHRIYRKPAIDVGELHLLLW